MKEVQENDLMSNRLLNDKTPQKAILQSSIFSKTAKTLAFWTFISQQIIDHWEMWFNSKFSNLRLMAWDPEHSM